MPTNQYKVLAIIPARAGSKGVVGKNKRKLAGIPLIEYSIRQAISAQCVTDVCVSSDDQEILRLCEEYPIHIVNRPAEIARDDSSVVDACKHAINQLKKAHNSTDFKAIVLLQPTSPFRTSEDIDSAIEKFKQNSNIPLCSVSQCEDAHPARMYSMEGGCLISLFPDLARKRRQELPAIFHRNGALYIFSQAHLDSGELIAGKMQPYVMPPEKSINIDTELDFALAELVLQRMNGIG